MISPCDLRKSGSFADCALVAMLRFLRHGHGDPWQESVGDRTSE